MKKESLFLSVIIHSLLFLIAYLVIVKSVGNKDEWVSMEFGSYSNSSKKFNHTDYLSDNQKKLQLPHSKNYGKGDIFKNNFDKKDSVSNVVATDSTITKYGNGKFEIDFQGKRKRGVYNYLIPTYPTGVDKEVLIRGGVITDRNDLSYFEDNPVLALSIELLNNSPVSLANRRRVLLIIGTTEIEGEIRLYEQKQINPSEKGIIFFKPDIPVLSYVGDHYIMRLPTPMVTLGGGQVLDHLPHFPRQRSLGKYRYLQKRITGQLPDLILSEVNKQVVIKQAEQSRSSNNPGTCAIDEAELEPFDVNPDAKRIFEKIKSGTRLAFSVAGILRE